MQTNHAAATFAPQIRHNRGAACDGQRGARRPIPETIAPHSKGLTMNYDQMSQAELIATLKAKDEAARQAAQRKLTLKVSKQGAVSLYGMGKFPVTLYAEQWGKVLDMSGDIKAFIEANRAILSFKN